MHLSRRMRLIWHKLWLIPLVGATADVVASEAAKLGGVTVPIPWLFSAIGVAGMLAAAVVRAYSVPLIPEGLETPDEALTRRSRVLGERLGATPVRVFVIDLPKLRGKVDTYLVGHDLFVSERVAELPEAERDFVLARLLAELTPAEARSRVAHATVTILVACAVYALSLISAPPKVDWPRGSITIWQVRDLALNMLGTLLLCLVWWRLRYRAVLAGDLRPWSYIALAVTTDLAAAKSVLLRSGARKSQVRYLAKEAEDLEKWWNTKGHKAVEASEWYQKELAKASETNPRSSRTLSGDSSIELPASETN